MGVCLECSDMGVWGGVWNAVTWGCVWGGSVWNAMTWGCGGVCLECSDMGVGGWGGV